MAHDALTEATLRNLVNLERIANGLSAEQRARVRSLFDEIVGLLAKHDPTAVSARYRQARIEKIMGEVETLTGQTFREFRKTLRADLARLAVQQTDHAVTMLRQATELVVDIRRSAMSLDFARTIIDRDPFEGLTLADWAEGQEVRTVQQVRRQIQLGMLNNESIPDITKRVKGVGASAEDNAEAVVRTAVNWISNDSHLRVYRANDDVLTAVQWTSTLDSRTCLACAEMDSRTWKLDDPSLRRPPLHFNDRCVLVPVVDWESLGLDAPEPGTRAARDDDGKSVQVSSQTTYENWLRGKSASFQDEVLGPSRGRLFRKGMSLSDMVRGDGSILTLDELEAA